jgi:hypothetical protein
MRIYLVALALVAGPALGEQISGADAGWAAMKRCAAIAEDKARHACTDDVLREARLLGVAVQAKPAVEPRSAVQPTPTVQSTPAVQSPPANAHKDFGLPPTPAPKPQPSESKLEVTLASVTQAGDGKLVMTTTDGATWRQVESEPIRPMPAEGQTMVIARKSLGGFMCESANRVAFRCYRTR